MHLQLANRNTGRLVLLNIPTGNFLVGRFEVNLKGQEGTFKSLLDHLDPSLRQRADRIHNEAHKPQTTEYLQQHRAVNTDNIAKDASGTMELFNDWSLPYDKDLNKVTFNNRLHTQMSFGVAEEI